MKRASSLRLRDVPTPSSFSSRSSSVWSPGMAQLPWMGATGVSGGGLRRQFFRRRLHGLDDVLVPGAAAQVAGHPVADFLFRGIRVFLEQAVRTGDHSRGAEAALERVVEVKRFLQRVQLARLREALDRQQLGA